MVVYEQALLALDRDDKPRPTPESSRGFTTEAEQRVERPSVSSEILAGRPFYLRAGMSVSTGMGVRERGWTGRRACVCERRTLPNACHRAGPLGGLLPPA